MKNTFIILISLLLFSCNRKETTQIPVIDLLAPVESEIVNLSEIAADVEYIPIQTIENSIIGGIRKVIVRENSIYIETQNGILCFNGKGQYLFKLNSTGRGPEEYVMIYDFDINTSNDSLILLVPLKILTYGILDNAFEYSNSINFTNSYGKIDFVPNKNNIVIYDGSDLGNEAFRNRVISLSGIILNTRLNYNKYEKEGSGMLGTTLENISFKYDNALYFKDMFCDTVFTIDSFNNFKPYIILNSHEKRPTAQARANTNYFMTQITNYYIITQIMEVSRYLIYGYSFEKSGHLIIYDKTTNERFAVDPKLFLKDDITGGINFEPMFCENGNLYSWVDALTLKNHVESEDFKNSVVKNPKKKIELENLAASLKETDNPVLVVVTLKE